MNEREIFEAALELTDRDARQAYLARACAGTPELRTQVEQLLELHDAGGDFLAQPAVAQLAGQPYVGKPQRTEPHDAGRTLRYGAGVDEEEDSALDYLEPSIQPNSLGRLGHYEVREVIGQGAFGTVFKAFDETLCRLVAIKVLNPSLAATSPPRKRFLREARSVAAIKHENIVQVHAVGESPLPYLVMEYIEGVSLQQKLDSAGPLELPEILNMGRQMAAGLAAAHEKGLIHRDIKPSNILIEAGQEQKVKITDFGLARAADDASVTRTGTIAGTPMYMAPEQALGQALDSRSDLFSLGSTFYQMACGRPPFRGPTALAVLKRVVEETPRPLQEILPDVPDWLCTIIAKLHAKQPDDRFQSAAEVAALLSQCQFELQRTGAVRAVAPTSQAMPVKAARGRREQKPRWTWRGTVVLACLLMFAIGMAGVFDLPLYLSDQAGFRNLTRDGQTRIDFRRDGNLVRFRNGYGNLQLPAGEYEVKIAHPDPTLRIYNVVLTRRLGPYLIETAILNSPPERLSLYRGERLDFMVAYTKITESVAPQKDETPAEETPEAAGSGWDHLPPDAPRPAIAPFDADQAKTFQQEWSHYLQVPTEYVDRWGQTFLLIPPGEFQMGNSPDDLAVLLRELRQANAGDFNLFAAQTSGPQHRVKITQPFYLSAYEVTVGTYRQFIETTKYLPTMDELGVNLFKWQQSISEPDSARRAVTGVSWNDAAACCQWLSHESGAHYSLPTEAQWEYACRAGTTTLWPLGNDASLLSEYAVYGRTWFVPTEIVGSKKPNPFGLYDLQGNAEEWCLDWHRANFYSDCPLEDPAMTADPIDHNSGRVCRGGSAVSPAWSTRSAIRPWDFAGVPKNPKGFRTALTVESVRKLCEQRDAQQTEQ